MKKFLLSVSLVIGLFTCTMAQSTEEDKQELEREKKAIQSELKEIQGAYDRVKGEKRQSLSQLNMLKRKITLQERYISSINKELKFIDNDIYNSNVEIYRLRHQVDTLKMQYARTVVYAYKNRSSFNYVNFIFSSNSFNDAVRRVSYLKSYRAYREKQVATILEKQQLLADRQKQQLTRKAERNSALKDQNLERSALSGQRKEKDAVVSKLKSQETDLKKQIAVKKKRDRDIQNAIAAIIRREIESAKKEEKARMAALKKAEDDRNKTTAVTPSTTKPSNSPNNNTATTTTAAKKPASYLELNAKDVELGADFGKAKGKLPWPVDNGFVITPFGRYEIENTSIVGNNPGLTIGTQAGSSVKAVFDGEVSAIHNYGEGVAVVIRHGKYFTSYSNLSSVSVSKGATIKRGQVIGKSGNSEDGSGGQVDFMLLIENQEVNPASWLRR